MAKRRYRRMDRELRRQIIGLAARGRTYDEIRDELEVSTGSISAVVRACGGVFRREHWSCPAFRLSLEERVEIYLGLQFDRSFSVIARELGRAVSTISREVNGHGGRDGYRPLVAHRQAALAARRPKATKLGSDPRLCARVVADLQRLWSPQQIARRCG